MSNFHSLKTVKLKNTSSYFYYAWKLQWVNTNGALTQSSNGDNVSSLNDVIQCLLLQLPECIVYYLSKYRRLLSRLKRSKHTIHYRTLKSVRNSP